MQKKNLRIVLTGGHAATTALSVVEEIEVHHPDWEIHWIGVQRAFEGKKIPTLEANIFSSKLNVKVHHIIAGRLQKKFTRWTLYSLLKLPLGFFYSLKLLLKIKPAVVLSFGGFAAYPVVVVTWLMRVPVIIHDQSTVAGRANIRSAFFAKY